MVVRGSEAVRVEAGSDCKAEFPETRRDVPFLPRHFGGIADFLGFSAIYTVFPK